MKKIFKNNSIKTFLLKLSVFFVMVFVLDFIIGQALKKYYFKQKTGNDQLIIYSIEKAKEDILIFGSSRAKNIFDSRIFENKIGLSCFNAGSYGEPIFYHYAILKGILNRHTPKIVLLSFDAGYFSKKQDAYDRLSVLLPYYEGHPEIRSVIALKGPYEKIKMLSNIYPYNSLLLTIIAGNAAEKNKKYHHADGFSPIKKTFTGRLQIIDYSKEKELDTVKINVYKSFIQDCINLNIQLYIVCPPYMINPIGTDRSISTAKNIAQVYGVNFFDYSRDSFFTANRGLFADFRHLNEEGDELFSNMVADKINSLK